MLNADRCWVVACGMDEEARVIAFYLARRSDGEFKWVTDELEALEFSEFQAADLATDQRAALPDLPINPRQLPAFVRPSPVGESPTIHLPPRVRRLVTGINRQPRIPRPRVTPAECFSALEGRGLA